MIFLRRQIGNYEDITNSMGYNTDTYISVQAVSAGCFRNSELFSFASTRNFVINIVYKSRLL